jgi:putative PIN family toxin of toxin-antitoxin system
MRKSLRPVVLDPSVLVSALIKPEGVPGRLLLEIQAGQFELIVSPELVGELGRVVKRDKFRRYTELDEALEFVSFVRSGATHVPYPGHRTPLRSPDPKDDYLIALAHGYSAILVSGDKHLLDLSGGAPILAPSDLLAA